MTFRIYPYKVGSASVQKLKTELDALIIRTENSRYRFSPEHIIINWGNSRRPAWMTEEIDDFILNKPEAVAVAANKLRTLQLLTESGVPTVPWTTMKSDAEFWANTLNKVYARHVLDGHSGEGIEVIQPNENLEAGRMQDIANELYELGRNALAESVEAQIELTISEVPDAPLYTLGVENHGEYRVHVFDGEVILYQKKSRRVDDDGNVITADGEEADVRNLASNWIYRTGNLNRLERVEELALNAVASLGLDFGAVDIIMDENGEVYVLEINTAPGLGNEDSLASYTAAFDSLNN